MAYKLNRNPNFVIVLIQGCLLYIFTSSGGIPLRLEYKNSSKFWLIISLLEKILTQLLLVKMVLVMLGSMFCEQKNTSLSTSAFVKHHYLTGEFYFILFFSDSNNNLVNINKFPRMNEMEVIQIYVSVCM